MENKNKKVNQILARNQVISSIIWAIVILACAYSSNKNITIILISGFFVEFLRISSANKSIKQVSNKDD
jgi:hypothetical protein